KVIEKELATEHEVNDMTEKEILNFIFRPGFSTAEKVTDVSGRGVGMDVVKTNISKLNGLIEIDSQFGKGSTITITLPLTVAIIQTLMVIVQDEIYGIPLASVLQTLIIPESEVKTVDQNEVINYRGSVLPIIRLSDVFDLKNLIKDRDETFKNVVSKREKRKKHDSSTIEEGSIYIIVIGMAELRLGVIVDSVLGQEEIVLKSFGEYLDAKGLSGATIMGDGCVTLVIDIEELFEISEETVRKIRKKKEAQVELTY
ncbi:MAG: chemotaxis protein CheW, partial [Nitrospinae bacterium]|nr:chemotaxis protein CheW [Nitrospinota bacterium]